jgi:hypothetical protein
MTAMKTTIKYFCMAALLVAVATIAGCTKEENNGDGQTLTTSVSLPDNDAKALDEHGVKTFAVGDQIKMTYTINEREKNIDSRPLTARDISANGKVANFSFIIPSGVTVPRNGNVRFQYPANFRTPITQGQDGTLATLASYYDLAICVTRFSSRSELPANIQLDNFCAILKLIFKNYAGTDITTSLTGLTVSVGSTNYTITPTPTGSTFASSPIYVAILMNNASSTQNITFTATGSNNVTYTKTATNKRLQRGHLYPVEVEMTAPMCTYTTPNYIYPNLTYNNSEQDFFSTMGGATNGTMYFRYDYVPFETTTPGITSSSTEWSTNRPRGKNAGTYTIYYKVVPNPGYEGGVEETQLRQSVINKANWTGKVTKHNLTSRNPENIVSYATYDANNSLTPVTAAEASNITCQWEYSYYNAQTTFVPISGGGWTTSPSHSGVGEWRVTYGADNNHNQTSITSWTFD